MIHPQKALILCLLLFCQIGLFAQNSVNDLKVINQEISSVNTTEKKVTTLIIEPENASKFKADIWPNPSNIGKVRLSLENLPKGPLFIQVFNDQAELIQEKIIDGTERNSLNHTLSLPDTSGTYSVKLSDNNRIIKDLILEIL